MSPPASLVAAIRGAGPPLVLVHGWAMHAGIFGPLAERLAARFTVHLVDLPGHGASRDAGDLALDPVLDRLFDELPPAPWVGWSLGGLFALRGALRDPARVTGLGMLCASPRFTAGPDWPHGVEPAVFHAFGEALAGDWRGTLDRFLALEAQGSDHLRDELRTLRETAFSAGEPRPEALATGLHLLETTDLRDGLPGLRVPSTWIAGRRDRLVDPRAMQAAAEACGGHFHRVEGAGHAPFLSHADAVEQALHDLADAAERAA